jgi:Flp pilus assembly pilin Flp
VLRAIRSFLKDQDQGQDLAEYCLITGLIVLIALGIFWRVSGGVQGMWDTANTTLVSGNSSSGPGSAGTSDTQGNLGQ